jgi:hypothetical protein
MATLSKTVEEKIEISEAELKKLLEEAARMGAQTVINTLVSFNMQDAAKQIGITPKTLNKRILEGKIKSVDKRISGPEIQRYLKSVHSSQD